MRSEHTMDRSGPLLVGNCNTVLAKRSREFVRDLQCDILAYRWVRLTLRSLPFLQH
jgi:hypothetical protein